MPTDLPKTFVVEHDYTALDAHTDSIRAKAKARLFLAIGAASLAAGAGVGLGAYGLSYLVEPKIIETTKVVTETKVERVEVEKPIVTEKVITVEKPVVIEKQVPAPIDPPPMRAPIPKKPAALVGAPSSEQAFINSPEYEMAEIHGRISGHDHGVIKFADGQERYDAFLDGTHDPRLTTSRHNGDFGFCRRLPGEFPNGNPRWDCRALHKGTVESIYSSNGWRTSPAPMQRQDADPISQLFN
jgi:hypothetical protein